LPHPVKSGDRKTELVVAADFTVEVEQQMGKFRAVVGLGLGLCITGSSLAAASPADQDDWPAYGGHDGTHYSSLTQINRDNVNTLKVAWTYDTGEKGGLESNPIKIGKVLYVTTPGGKVVALDAATGKLIWKWQPGLQGWILTRGVSYWTDGHQSRILSAARNYLYAIDAATGKTITSFGENGRIDLRKGLREPYQEQNIALTSPGTIYKDLIITGGSDPETHPAPPGDIRAYDVRTGALRWTFHTIPHPGEFGYDTWPRDAYKTASAANNWAGMNVDVKRGIVYVPTGSPAFDFYGGDRVGNNLFGNSMIALDAATGKRVWHFQDIHHDLWDRDFPAPPALLTITRNGKRIDAVADTSKAGYLFVFNRETGEPIFPVKEVPVPKSTVPGEVASPTQPVPSLPAPYTQQSTSEDTLTNRTPEAHAWALKQFRTMIGGGQFIPPTVDKLTIDMPGFAGGGEWGGVAVDPDAGILYVNANDTAWLVGLTVPPKAGSLGEKVYQNQCSGCHGINRAGSPPAIPALEGIEGILTDQEITTTIRTGKGRMPPFNSLSDDQVQAVVRYLTRAPQQDYRPKKKSTDVVADEASGGANDMPYKTIGFRRFTDPEGYPATAPPWGTLSAIDLNTGKYLWKIPFGTYPELVAKGMADTGSDNYGGPVVTASGLLFIAATVFDQKFHAYDKTTGKLLWETDLPFAGLATCSTYMVNGKQYVVVPAGGGQSSGKPSGGLYVAYALP
jgi:quinoprotein glucose dehydrogenase